MLNFNLFKKIVPQIFIFIILIFSVSAISYNEAGDFTLDIPNLKQTTLNDNINAEFDLTITNNLNTNQDFQLTIPEVSGWDIAYDDKDFNIGANQEKKVKLYFSSNSNFKYEQSVVSPSEIVISQNEDYVGSFDFPVVVIGEAETVSVKYTVDIKPEEKLETIYNIDISTNTISPTNPLGYSIRGENIDEIQEVKIIINIANEEFIIEDKFNKNNYYKIYQQPIPTSIDPGTYNVKVTLRLLSSGKDKKIIEWSEDKKIILNKYENLVVDENSKKSLIKDNYFFNIKNNGNTKAIFEKEVEMNWFNSLIFSTNQDSEYYTETESGLLFSVPLEKGESKTIEIEFNYIIIYITLITIIVISTYIFVRKNSNPLDIETKIYEIKKVKHEGIKSMKVRLGFENIKEAEIETLTLRFRMPAYLKVKDNSFLLTEPKKILKGNTQYKLIWDFKRFEKNDSRILGFSLMNTRGILGDIKIPNLEIEVKSKGKIRKYYKSFQTIKG